MLRRLPAAAALALIAAPAAAHTGHASADGLLHGFVHPMGGYDHVLAMIAVGLWAAQIGGRARWLLPLAFVSTMAIGGFLGMAGVNVPSAEAGILASLVILGVAIATAAHLPLALSAGAVALFAVVHGYAHGAEMLLGTNGLAYGVGYAGATVLLHMAGLGLATVLRHAKFVRPLGVAIAIAGVALGIA